MGTPFRRCDISKPEMAKTHPPAVEVDVFLLYGADSGAEHLQIAAEAAHTGWEQAGTERASSESPPARQPSSFHQDTKHQKRSNAYQSLTIAVNA